VERAAPEVVKPSVHPVRAFLETALVFAANATYYWWNKDFNAPDWELGWDWDSWNKKLFTLEGGAFSTRTSSPPTPPPTPTPGPSSI
jgi:hypothetical protein